MRMHVPLLVVLSGFVPIGMAVAEYADAAAATPAGPDHAQDLVALGQCTVESVWKARSQLAAALERARSSRDVALASCFERKLEELSRLDGTATAQLTLLRRATDAGTARVPYITITVLGQKASLVVEQAALCVGAGHDQPDLQFDDIAPPTHPSAGAGRREPARAP